MPTVVCQQRSEALGVFHRSGLGPTETIGSTKRWSVDSDETTRRLLDAGEGLVTRGQLRWAGVESQWIRRRVRRGSLIMVHPQVLAARELMLDRATMLRAAVLQAGSDAVLTHSSALEVWGLFERVGDLTVHVAVPRPGGKSWPGIRLHRRTPGPASARVGLPLVEPIEALAVAAADLSMDELRFPAMEAVLVGLVTPKDLADSSRFSPNVRGKMRMLAEEAAAGAESGGEAKYWRLLKESRLPMPLLQQRVETSAGFKRIDAYWGGYGLGVEIDGRRFHQKEAAFERNKVRRNSIHALDVTILEFSVDQVMSTPLYVLEETEANLLAREYRLKRSG